LLNPESRRVKGPLKHQLLTKKTEGLCLETNRDVRKRATGFWGKADLGSVIKESVQHGSGNKEKNELYPRSKKNCRGGWSKATHGESFKKP